MASHFNTIWNNNWHLITPVALLSLFFLYILIPGNIEKDPNTNEITELATEKARLEGELNNLQNLEQNSYCSGGQLVVPTGQENAFLPPNNEATLAQKLEKSVVLVLVFSSGDEGMGLGSGFFISPSQVVTNGHVISEKKVRPKAVFVLNKHIGIQEVRIETLDFDNDNEGDFAVLSLTENIGTPLPLANFKDPSRSKLSSVYAAGFPGDVIQSDEEYRKLMEADEFSMPDLVITDGTISSHQNVFGAASAFVHTAMISQGNSGGPLVNECGQVMGVNTFVLSTDTGVRNFSLTSIELSKHLRKNGLSPRLAPKECK